MPRIKDIYYDSLLPGLYNRVINVILTQFNPDNPTTVLKFNRLNGNVFSICDVSDDILLAATKRSGSDIKTYEIDKNNFPVYTKNDIYIGYVNNGLFYKSTQSKFDMPETEELNNHIINKIRAINIRWINSYLEFMFNIDSGVTALVNEKRAEPVQEVFVTTPTENRFDYDSAYFLDTDWYPIFNNKNEYITFHKR